MQERTNNRRQGSRIGWLVAVLIATVAVAVSPTAARADGDPASDVLATQPVFLPQDAGIPLGQQGQVTALVQSASRAGYPIRVALIATRSDLGSVTELWREPQTYAQFLGQELSLVYRGPLLVVMPNGFGFSSAGSAGAEPPSVLGGVPIRSGQGGLAPAALGAVQRLAASAGHDLAIPPSAASVAPRRSSDLGAIVALAIGAALIVVAWAASLRARPPRALRRP
jgi:hypothetical protein